MRDHLTSAISGGFQGEWTHIDPKYVFIGLTPITAKKKPNNDTHSCWELLYHIVLWQDTMIKSIKGETVDWNEIEKKDNWPTNETMNDDSNFSKLLDKFNSGIKEARNLLESVDFVKKSVGFPELSTIKLFIALLQHTSYHVGQIVTIRQNLGDWPPTKDDK
ncbi:MAG: DinB family protein [Candidatus Hodarchaeales archaeon]|jgi:uncharacterized damage-inducible protein DinB